MPKFSLTVDVEVSGQNSAQIASAVREQVVAALRTHGFVGQDVAVFVRLLMPVDELDKFESYRTRVI